MVSGRPELWKPQLDKTIAPPEKRDITALTKAVKAVEPVLRRCSDRLYWASYGSGLPARSRFSMADTLGAHYDILRWRLKSAVKHLEGAIKEIEQPGSTHGWAQRLGLGFWTGVATTLLRVNWASFLWGAAITVFVMQLLFVWTPL